MAIGDIGGPLTELAMILKIKEGDSLSYGDAVALCSPYTVTNNAPGKSLFGMVGGFQSDSQVLVVVKGVCVLRSEVKPLYAHATQACIRLDSTPGTVYCSDSGYLKHTLLDCREGELMADGRDLRGVQVMHVLL